MELPKFLMADCADLPDNAYVLHTQKPRFIIDVDTEDYLILDDSAVSEKEMESLIESALTFYESELDKYGDEIWDINDGD